MRSAAPSSVMSVSTRYSRTRGWCGGDSIAMRHLAWLIREGESARASGVGAAVGLYAHARTGLNRGAPFVAIYEFDGYRPVVHESAFVHPQAAVTWGTW